MIREFKDLIPKEFNGNSRVWIYQADREFTSEEVAYLKQQLVEFNKHWDSHGVKLCSYADVFFSRFIILIADGSVVGICGGSVDESTRFIKDVEKRFSVNLFDRQLLAFFIDEKIETIPLSNINSEIENGFVTSDTLYFNNTILTKKELLENWIIPVKNSWLASRLPDFSN